MSSTNAERQRRYRAHKRGDHSLCLDPGRCGARVDVTTRVTGDGVTSPAGTPVAQGAPPAPNLGPRGRRLWRQVTGDGGPALRPAELVLLEEACRTADRLDRLDAYLRGDEEAWLKFHTRNEDGSIVEVVVDKALSEARQQQTALKQILAELRVSRAEPGGQPRRGMGGQARTSGTGAKQAGKGGRGVVADLTARIAERASAG